MEIKRKHKIIGMLLLVAFLIMLLGNKTETTNLPEWVVFLPLWGPVAVFILLLFIYAALLMYAAIKNDLDMLDSYRDKK